MKVGALDLGIVIAYVAAVTLFGLWAGRGARTLADYSAAGRNLPWWVVMISIVATETSTVTFLSIPGFAFGRDLTWLQIALGFAAGRCLVALWMLPQYFRGSFLTSYEVLAQRFGGSTQQTASLLFIVTRTLADGIRLFLTALVLHEMTGLPIPWAVAGVGIVMIVYTYVGGVKAVIWTEFAQFGIYVGGALLAFGLLIDRLPGGLSGALADAGAAGKLRVFDFTLDPSEPYASLGGAARGNLRHVRIARRRSTDGAALFLRPEPGRRAKGSGGRRARRARPVRFLPAPRHGTLGLLPGPSPGRGRRRHSERSPATTGSSPASFSRSCPPASSDCCSARSSPPRCRARSTPARRRRCATFTGPGRATSCRPRASCSSHAG